MRDTKLLRERVEARVGGPQGDAIDDHGSEQVHVDPSDAPAVEPAVADELHDLSM